MDDKKKKGVLVLIIILLVITLLFGGTGAYFKFFKEGSNNTTNNKSKEFYNDGKLHFYSGNTLLGTYQCKNEYCDYAKETIDDSNYELKFYNDETIDKIEYINSRYAFIVDSATEDDNSNIILYDFVNGQKLKEYSAVKNYTIGLENDKFFVADKNGKWGLITLTSNFLIPIIENKYDFIGLTDKKNNDNLLATDTYVVKEGSAWYLIDEKKADISSKLYFPIVDYNGKNIIAAVNTNTYLYDYQGSMQLSGTSALNIDFVGKYVSVLDNNYYFYVYDVENHKELTPKLYVNPQQKYSAVIENSQIKITIGDVVTTYDIV